MPFKDPEKRKLWWKQYYSLHRQEEIERVKSWNKTNRLLNGDSVREYNRNYMRVWNRKNRRLYNNDFTELDAAIYNVRKRDKNTCQWYGCDLTCRDITIHVHHIFPRSEYPEFELMEKYMICYCWEHHALWHKHRGDKYWRCINGVVRERSHRPVLDTGYVGSNPTNPIF